MTQPNTRSTIIETMASQRFWRNVDKSGDGCWNWTGRQSDNGRGMHYGAFNVGKKNWRAHRFAWVLANGPIPGGKLVLHSCDNPLCVNVQHLRVGTHKDNMRDCLDRGRFKHLQGREVASAKLDDETVLKIREALKAGRPKNALAREYGVSFPTIHDAARGVTWGHVLPPDASPEDK